MTLSYDGKGINGPDEYRDLAKELAGIGYNLEIVKRFTSKMRCKRMAAD